MSKKGSAPLLAHLQKTLEADSEQRAALIAKIKVLQALAPPRPAPPASVTLPLPPGRRLPRYPSCPL